MRFYELEQSPEGDTETCYSKEAGYTVGDAASCPECGGTISMLRWLPPFRVEIELHDKEFGDFAFAPAANDILVSQKFRDVYFDHKLTGLSGFDLVEVLRIKSRKRQLPKPPVYFRVSVTAIASNSVTLLRAACKRQRGLDGFLRSTITHGGFFHVGPAGCSFYTV